MSFSFSTWQIWAVLSALFAALTAIFAKLGVENINSNFATLIRTGIILVMLAAIVLASRSYQSLSSISGRTYLFLALSGAATGLSWLCYYRALQLGPASAVAPIDKLSVVLVAVFGVSAPMTTCRALALRASTDEIPKSARSHPKLLDAPVLPI